MHTLGGAFGLGGASSSLPAAAVGAAAALAGGGGWGAGKVLGGGKRPRADHDAAVVARLLSESRGGKGRPRGAAGRAEGAEGAEEEMVREAMRRSLLPGGR